MDVAEHLDHLADAGSRLAAAAGRAALSDPVPTCPEWSVRDLVRHTGAVHRWATMHVRDRPAQVIRRPQEELVGGWPPDDDLLAWFRNGHETLLAELRAAPADLECATFLSAPSPLAMWSRRQAHETTIHRIDAELAAGVTSPVDPALAADGIDELLTCFITRPGRGPHREVPAALAIRPTDVDAGWTVRLSPDDVEVARDGAEVALDAPGALGDEADVVVRGPASDLYLLVWNRAFADDLVEKGVVSVDGDASLLDHWRAQVQVRMR
jgi:uncharacterized protein (TIGR03083 family)